MAPPLIPPRTTNNVAWAHAVGKQFVLVLIGKGRPASGQALIIVSYRNFDGGAIRDRRCRKSVAWRARGFFVDTRDIHQIRCVFGLETSAVEAFSVEGVVIPT